MKTSKFKFVSDGAGVRKVVTPPVVQEEGDASTGTPIFPIYMVTVTDGAIPGENNLLHVTASFPQGEGMTRSWNILPQVPIRRSATRLKPSTLAAISRNQVPVAQAMRELAVWLEKFKGQRQPVASSIPFWHILYHMRRVQDPPPFRSSPIDIVSFCAGAKGDLKHRPRLLSSTPEKSLANRIATVSEATESAGEFRW